MVADDQLIAPATPAAGVSTLPRQTFWSGLWQHEWLVVLLLGLWAVFLLAWRLPEPNQYIYDEVYHAYTGNLMQQNDPAVYEWWKSAPQEPIKGVQYEWTHPPLGKLIIGGSIKIFGNESLGWRFSNMVFGVISSLLLYALARVLFRDRVLATFALFIIPIEGLMFAESRIGTNDIFQLAFLLAAYTCFAVFFHRPAPKAIGWLFVTGVFLGLGWATKWPSLYSIVLLGGVAGIRAIWPERWTRRWQARPVVEPEPATVFDMADLPAYGSAAPPPDAPAGNGRPVDIAGDRALEARARFAYTHASVYQPTDVAPPPPPAAVETADGDRWGFWARVGYLAAAFVALVVVPVAEYVLSYLQMFLQTHQIPPEYAGVGPFTLGPLKTGSYQLPNSDWWSMFIGEQWQMWHYHTTLTAGHPYYSKPWQWLLDIRPVFYYVNRTDSWVANTYNLGNPLLYWFFPLAIVGSLMLIWKRRDLALALVAAGFFINWAVWALSPRGMFFYHFLPSVPFAVLMVCYGLTRMHQSGSKWLRRLSLAYVAIVFLSFAFFLHPARRLAATLLVRRHPLLAAQLGVIQRRPAAFGC
ncbi:MAG: glycosyltransferase family 39 protein [Chloroflexi bacterium]|nr:glycosyltransferase family 39 protein [Chloroflexota bacterium]